MTIIKKTIKYIAIFLIFVMSIVLVNNSLLRFGQINETVSAANEEDKIVRVGLEGLYYNKSSIYGSTFE